ncbi:hypothetical protein DIPPA_28995 [Diplonema papillatum]|nr:hypothetical protein DIPPA_28995 [Diplonema papillatum]KAJ9472220.1 hypothetical protein DIPPA_28995 [Diplonema papillatum]
MYRTNVAAAAPQKNIATVQRLLVASVLVIVSGTLLFGRVKKNPTLLPITRYSDEEVETFLFADEASLLKEETVDADATEKSEDPDSTDAPTPAPAPAHRDDKPPAAACSKWDEIKEGTLKKGFRGGARWVPKSGCILDLGRRVPWAKRCVMNQNVVFLGDVLTYFFATKVAFEARTPYVRNRKLFKLKDGSDCAVRHCGFKDLYRTRTREAMPKQFSFYHTGDVGSNQSLSRPETLEAIRSADILVYGTTLLDMGPSFSGPNKFFRQSLARLGFLKENLKPEAKLMVYPVYTLQTHKTCERGHRCFRCYSPRKADVFREALMLAASCAGLPALNIAPMTLHAQEYTRSSGFLYNMKHRIGADIFLAAFCGNKPNLLVQPDTCEIESAQERWSKVPQAQVGCRSGQQLHPRHD